MYVYTSLSWYSRGTCLAFSNSIYLASTEITFFYFCNIGYDSETGKHGSIMDYGENEVLFMRLHPHWVWSHRPENPTTSWTEAEGSQVQWLPGKLSKTLSQN